LKKIKSDKLRVAVLGLRGFPDIQGGIEKHCQELYPRLTKYNCDITVFARKGYVNRPYNYNGVKILPLWAPRQKSLENMCHTALGILWLGRHRKEYDILHLHAVGPAFFSYVARKLGIRPVVTNHGPEYDRQKWGTIAKFIQRLGERVGARYAYVVIAVSNHIKNMLFKKYGSHAEYIPNGVNMPDSEPPGDTLAGFNLEPGRYFLSVGRLVPEKGFHDLIDAFATLKTDWKLAIVGEADHEDGYSIKLKKKAKQVDGVIMTGFQKGKALRELFSNAGLFVLPSYHEGLPIVALEAMSYNLPMLVSDIPANKEVALPEEMFSVGDVGELSNRLAMFLNDPSSLNSPEILNAKKHRIETEFNWDVIAKQTAEIYREVARPAADGGKAEDRR